MGAREAISTDRKGIRKLLTKKNHDIWAERNVVGGESGLAAPAVSNVKMEGERLQNVKQEPDAKMLDKIANRDRYIGSNANRDDECTICLDIAQRSNSVECPNPQCGKRVHKNC